MYTYIYPSYPGYSPSFSRHPEDVDLFTGGLSERTLPGSAIGPTFSCIIARQFHNLKVGDRFWYENPLLMTGFTEGQLAQIKRVTLAKLLCDNYNLQFMQRDVFRFVSPRDPSNGHINIPRSPTTLEKYTREEVQIVAQESKIQRNVSHNRVRLHYLGNYEPPNRRRTRWPGGASVL
ncbi:hypothetical protein FSP39_023817 [Pinctada imbricata]|uniref:Peroxidasin n=1 Tax=Pinctada imbricata TaxID=66713 RepID=A0AA88YAM0_PINIB|nr:hypothetical protein FSP39_023817 [Pinctada imbricata]